MSVETTLRMVMIGLIVFVVVVSFALDENSYSRRHRTVSEPEPETSN